MTKHKKTQTKHDNRLNTICTITNKGGVQIININNTPYKINKVNTTNNRILKHKDDKQGQD